ncbi:twin-arginine translocation pathway signal [Rhodococcus sp. SRB_17]|uniref:twin-arginine translocation pathway signal n=1 Tax=Rhodococcus sp. OK302 TaxID=1882769 RepID=UPI000B94423A|nr:twin-arginine translocation pathway signal [Rhodococcus sp. OK302]NMM82956.1 twin-arginine translocation pathway signal [Rhodococcus sp. SRB_17]OYD68091.1 Mce-associated membrane protein [Rhodococcus sp. OK302]
MTQTTTEFAPIPSPSSRVSVLTIVLCVISAVAIALAAVSAWLYFGPGGARDIAAIDQARAEVTQVSSDQAVAMFQYDHNNVDQQLHAATDGLTGEFQNTFTKLIESAIIPGAQEKALTVQVVVQGASILDVGPDTATTMLFLNQITTSKDSPEAVASGSRVKMGLEKQDGHWLVNSVQPF